MKADAGRPRLAALAVLALLWLAMSAWLRPLMLPDEGRYVGVAWEMLRSGDWLTPTLNGLPFFHKPPLFYWLSAASLAVFGPHDGAARAAPLIGAWLGAASLYLFARRWCGERAARYAGLALLVQPLWFVSAQFANLDMLVAGCITATILLLAHAALSLEQQPQRGWRGALAGAYAMAALGVLAKGLIGVVIPALVLTAWLLIRRRWRILLALLWWPGLLLMLALSLPWFWAMQARHPGFLDYFFVVQHFQRFAADGFNNAQPFWFYPAVLLAFSLPMLPWLLRGFRPARPSPPPPDPVRLLMRVWAIAVVLFFSLPRSKLVGYVLPAVPALAWLMADGYLSLIAPAPRAKKMWWAGIGAAALLGLGAVAALALYQGQSASSSSSSRQLATLLRTQRGAQEPVFMLGSYLYDLPFYARLDGGVGVVEDWASPEIDARDNWRKELADAARFAPAAVRAAALIAPEALAGALCQAPRSWVIGSKADADRYPLLAPSESMSSTAKFTLWRVDRDKPAVARALGCAEQKPSAGLPSKSDPPPR